MRHLLTISLLLSLTACVGVTPSAPQATTPPASIAPLTVHPPKISQRLADRSEEHTSELQSLMRISYAVFCLKKKMNILCYTSTTVIYDSILALCKYIVMMTQRQTHRQYNDNTAFTTNNKD